MKFTIAICLLFTHYMCGGPCVVEKDTSFNIAYVETFSNVYKATTFVAVCETPQITQPTSRIIYNKRFVKRYRKAQRLLNAWLHSNEINAGFCRYKPTQNIQPINHPFNPWLPAYLSLFAVFEV